MGEKNPWTKNLTPNKSHNKFTSLKNLQKGKQDWLYLNRSTMWPGYVGTSMNLQIVLNAQKILTKFSYPKKFLLSSPSLEIWSAPPLGVPACIDDSLQSSSHETIDSNFPLSVLLLSSLRKWLTFGNATTGFPTKWCLRNERRNPILMTCHYLDLGSASDWSCCMENLIQPIRSTTQIWVVTCHQYGISALVSQTSFGG